MCPEIIMFPRASASFVSCIVLVTHAVLVQATEIIHRDIGVVVKEETTVNQHKLVKRQVHENMLGFNEEQKYDILRRHNYLRSQHRSSNMMTMDWDSELENLAQAWAEKCKFMHSTNRDRQGVAGFSYVGENLYATTDIEFNPVDVVQSWYDEVKHYDYEKLTCTPNEQCGHYTQIVWAKSTALGCSVKYCKHLQAAPEFNLDHGYYVVCHYGPGGNIVGMKPYIIGEPCSNCPKEANFCVRDMCALRPEIGSRANWMHDSKSISALSIISIVAFHLVLS